MYDFDIKLCLFSPVGAYKDALNSAEQYKLQIITGKISLLLTPSQLITAPPNYEKD